MNRNTNDAIWIPSAQGAWVLEQSRKEAEMAMRTNGIGSSPVRN